MHEMLATTFAGQSGRDHVLQRAGAPAQVPLGG
jgi:hypothetical protein